MNEVCSTPSVKNNSLETCEFHEGAIYNGTAFVVGDKEGGIAHKQKTGGFGRTSQHDTNTIKMTLKTNGKLNRYLLSHKSMKMLSSMGHKHISTAVHSDQFLNRIQSEGPFLDRA